MVCVRRAWLTLGASSIELEDQDGGWFCTALDLGYPEVRAVVSNRPDQNGIVDRTALFGSRAVTAEIVTYSTTAASIDNVADSFAPYMVPNVRPTLHYILDRPGAPERTLELRAADYGWTIEGDDVRNIHLGWIAADPIARGSDTSSATAWAGAAAGTGRVYNLTFARSYPAGSSSATTGKIRPAGDMPVYPLYRIYGPITKPFVRVQVRTGAGAFIRSIYFGFLASFSVNAGAWVDVDSAAKTAILNSDPAQNVQSLIDWTYISWGGIEPTPVYGDLTLTGSSTSDVTQVQAIWTDGYLT